jgi:hypothetical protein
MSGQISRRDLLRYVGYVAMGGGLGTLSILAAEGQKREDEERERRDLESRVTVVAIPNEVIEVKGRWKMGPFTIGYRIATPKYIIASGYGGLHGQEGQPFAGPGLVDDRLINSFGVIAQNARIAQASNEPMSFFGNEARMTGDFSIPYIYQGKRVVILRKAEFRGQEFTAERSK